MKGNINTVDQGTMHSASAVPFPLTKFLFPSVLFSFFAPFKPHFSHLPSSSVQTIFPYLAKGRTTRIKLVLARPRSFVFWVVTGNCDETDHQSHSLSFSGDMKRETCNHVPAVTVAVFYILIHLMQILLIKKTIWLLSFLLMLGHLVWLC